MKSESDGPKALDDFGREEGIPMIIRSDNSKMQRYGTQFLSRLREWLCGAEYTEPHHPWQNPAELKAAKWLKQGIRTIRARTGAPKHIWLYIGKYMAAIHNVTADETLDWNTPWSKRKGETPDISAYLQFRFYERIYYLDPEEKFPGTREKPGYWIGVTDNVGDALCYYILTTKGTVIERSVIRSAELEATKNLTIDFKGELEPNHILSDIESDNESYTKKENTLKSENRLPLPRKCKMKRNPRYEDKGQDHKKESSSIKHKDRRNRDPDPDPHQHIIPPSLRRSERNLKKIHKLFHSAQKEKWNLNPNSKFISTHPKYNIDVPNSHTIEITDKPDYCLKGLDHIEEQQLKYVQSLDSYIESDDDNSQLWSPTHVIDHRVITKGKMGRKVLRVKVGWLTESPSWIDADSLRIQDPILLITYAYKRKLYRDPRWKWTIGVKEDDINNMIKAFKAKIDPRVPKYKFGIEVPKSIAHAFLLDKINGNNEWQLAIEAELKQINDYKTFRQVKSSECLQDFQKIPYHFVFDVKFDLRRKARLVAGGIIQRLQRKIYIPVWLICLQSD